MSERNNATKAKFYQTMVMFDGASIGGCYRYRDFLQVVPLREMAGEPFQPFIRMRPALIQLRAELPRDLGRRKMGGFDHQITPVSIAEMQYMQSRILELTHLLTVLLRKTQIKTFTRLNQSWFVPMPCDGRPIYNGPSIWGQEGFRDFSLPAEASSIWLDTLSDSQQTPAERIDRNEYYQEVGIAGLYGPIPDTLDYCLSIYFSLSGEARTAYNNACQLFWLALETGRTSPSVACACLVSAVETLVAHENRAIKSPPCETCGQPRFRVTAKFKEFMAKYGRDDSTYRKRASDLYKLRSKILHEGRLLFIDQDIFCHDEESIEEMHDAVYYMRSVRICMVNWLMAQAEKSRDDARQLGEGNE